MSGAQVSSFPSQNLLFEAASGQALQRGQANAQALGANEMEYMARAAQGILTASGGDEAKLAELYPAAVADLQRYGFARNAPAVSPGKAAIERIAALGTPSATLGEQRGNLAANASFVSGIKGAQPNALMTPAPGATTSSTPTEPGAPPDYSVPRGTRNNNPLNLSFANQPGATMENHPNPRFAAFATPEEGVSAAVNQLKLYQSRGNSTLRGMISTWAPPSENDTEAYVRQVAQTTGLDPDKPVDLNDPAVASKLVQAMARQETGRPLDPTVADRGVSAPVAPRGVAARTGGVDVAGPTGTVPGTPPAPGVTPPVQTGQQQTAAVAPAQQQTAAADVNVPPAGSYTPSQIQDFETLAKRPKATTADLINLRAKFDDDNEKARQNALTRQRQGAADARQAEQDRIAAEKRQQDQVDRLAKIEADRVTAEREGRKEDAARLAAQGVEQQRKFDQADKLRDEFQKLTGDFRVVQTAYENIRSAAKANDGAGDMSMLYSYVKLLDPTSVVRESEFATAAASGSYGERVQGAVQRVLSGARMPESLRQSFLRESKNIYANQRRGHDTFSTQYETLATRSGLDPDMVVTRFDRPQDDDGPKVGTIEDGYRFKGGDPAKPSSWEKVE